jgi:hypothetical protein
MSALILLTFNSTLLLPSHGHFKIARPRNSAGGGHTVTGVERVIFLVGFELIGEALACGAIWNEAGEQHSPPLREKLKKRN